MNKPNHNFHLTVKELALIEIALIHYQTESSPNFDDKMVSGPTPPTDRIIIDSKKTLGSQIIGFS